MLSDPVLRAEFVPVRDRVDRLDTKDQVRDVVQANIDARLKRIEKGVSALLSLAVLVVLSMVAKKLGFDVQIPPLG